MFSSKESAEYIPQMERHRQNSFEAIFNSEIYSGFDFAFRKSDCLQMFI